MGDSAERADQAAAKSDGRARREPPQPAPGLDPVGFGAQALMLEMQQVFGNQAVARLLDRGRIDPASASRSQLIGRMLQPGMLGPGTIRRKGEPNASMPPPPGPNQSLAPAPTALRNNGINYQGEMIYPDAARSKATLKKLLPAKGFHGASSFGSSFATATNETKATWSLLADADYQKRCQDGMKSAVTEFDEECRIFIEKFEMTAGNTTDAMLTNATEQIHKEQAKLGMKTNVSVDRDPGMPGTVTTTYTASNKSYLAETKTAAAALAEKRSLADMRKGKAETARKQAEAMRAALPAAVPLPAGSAPAAPAQIAPGVTLAPSAGQTEEESTRQSWKEAEEDYRKAAGEATAKYATLGPIVMGGGPDTTEKLRAFSKESARDSEQDIGEQFSKKLTNIEKVRSELGGRFSIWTQPTIISIVHQQMKSDTGQQRLVADKAKDVKAKDEDRKEMYAAIALGLGLLAAIPTGGSSVIAGVALAASVGGAAMSAYSAYQESQDYLLQSAAANTSLDRANVISNNDPSLLFLAIDIATAVADLGAAKAAFTAIKDIYLAAKAAKSLEKLPELVGAMRRASISPANQGKILDEVLPVGGDLEAALKAIRKAFVETAAVGAEKETHNVMKLVAEKAFESKKVIMISSDKLESIKLLKQQLPGRVPDPDKTLKTIIETFFGKSTANGSYMQGDNIIVLKGSWSADVAASVLVHETTHTGQAAQKLMTTEHVFRNEFEAFKAEQQFLRWLPPDRIDKLPAEYKNLLKWEDKEIEAHVLAAYAERGAVKPESFDPSDMADGIYNTLFLAGGRLK